MSTPLVYPKKTGTLKHPIVWIMLQPPAQGFSQVARIVDKSADASATKHKRIRLKATSQRRVWKVRVLQQAKEEASMFSSVTPEYLTQARFMPPSKIELTFADGLKALHRFAELEIDPTELQPETVRASKSGNSLEVRTQSGRRVYIDSATIRALVDPVYAEKTRQAFLKLRGPLEELGSTTIAQPQLIEK